MNYHNFPQELYPPSGYASPPGGGYPSAVPPPPGYPSERLPPPLEGYPPPPPPPCPPGYQGYFNEGYPPPHPQHLHHQHYDYQDDSLCSFLRGCLAALCCCFVLEQCCFL